MKFTVKINNSSTSFYKCGSFAHHLTKINIFFLAHRFSEDDDFTTAYPVQPALRDDTQLSVDEYRKKLYETIDLNEFRSSRAVSYTQYVLIHHRPYSN